MLASCGMSRITVTIRPASLDRHFRHAADLVASESVAAELVSQRAGDEAVANHSFSRFQCRKN